MSDFSSMSRESKKDKLRRQIVSPQQPAWNAEPEEDSEAVVRRAHNRVLRHRWILVLLVLPQARLPGSFISAITAIPVMKQHGRWI